MDDMKLNEDDLLDIIPLDNSNREIVQKIIDEKDINNLKNLSYLFNLNQAKKNVLRVLKLNNLLDRVSDQMIERFEKRPGEFSNNDLLNYFNVTQNAIDRANKSINLVDETPAIQFNQLNVNLKEEDILDKESRERVKDAVKAIMSKLGKVIEPESEPVLIDEEINVDMQPEGIYESKLSEEPDDRTDQ